MWQLIARFLARPTVANWIIRRAQRRPYDFLVIRGGRICKMPNDYPLSLGGEGYMRRWWLFRPLPLLGVRVHHIMAPDPGRDMHSHPWPFRTFILHGRYCERLPRGAGEISWLREPGESAAKGRDDLHRISYVSDGGCWTLFVTWGRRGDWGFRVNGKMVDHKEYHG